jgi:hypothetical protein
MRLPAIALFKFFNASYKLTESGTIATEISSVLARNHPVIGTVATETGGTMATETSSTHWHNINEMTGTTSPKRLAQWRPNYPTLLLSLDLLT